MVYTLVGLFPGVSASILACFGGTSVFHFISWYLCFWYPYCFLCVTFTKMLKSCWSDAVFVAYNSTNSASGSWLRSALGSSFTYVLLHLMSIFWSFCCIQGGNHLCHSSVLNFFSWSHYRICIVLALVKCTILVFCVGIIMTCILYSCALLPLILVGRGMDVEF